MALCRTTLPIWLVAATIWGALAGAPAGAAAAPVRRRVAEGDVAPRAALVAERQRVRADLERANAEIDALKRSSRGLRDDYRLRERLADAEALARRLTELDARLGTKAPSAAAIDAEPRVSAADGPAEIEAKADILADQAQRLDARAEALLGRARDLRARQALRRRVGQMERDPFSPLEGSKRRTMAGTSTGNSNGGGAAFGSSGPSRGPTTTPGTTDKAGGGAGGVTMEQTAPSTPATAVGSPGQTNQSTGSTAGHAVASPTTAPTPTNASDASALSSQLRDLLDPATLAQIRQLEAAGGPGAGEGALERAGAALKARADRLRQQAASLRATEHAPPRR
jgi:hypothetical protein